MQLDSAVDHKLRAGPWTAPEWPPCDLAAASSTKPASQSRTGSGRRGARRRERKAAAESTWWGEPDLVRSAVEPAWDDSRSWDTDRDVVVDGDLITARTGGHCHPVRPPDPRHPVNAMSSLEASGRRCDQGQ